MYPALMSLLSKAGAAMSGGGSAAASGIGMTGAGSMGGGGASAAAGAKSGGLLGQAASIASHLGPNNSSAGASQAQQVAAPDLGPTAGPQPLGGGQSWQRYRQRGLF